MTGIVISSEILLWIAVITLSVLVAALARQVGVLHERIAPAGALTLHQKVRVGDDAPILEIIALDGKTVQIGGARASRSQLLFFLSPDCPVCKTLLPIIRSVARAERRWVDIVLASDGDAADHRRLVMSQDLGGIPYILSEELGRTLGVSRLPYAVLIDEHGKIASLGLVNSREHLESLFEAKERGVASIQQYLAGA